MKGEHPIFTYNELMVREGIDPAKTIVFRHRPMEPELNRNFDWIVSERPDLFDCYQNSHNEKTEKALKRASHVASFIRRGPGEALYIGTYEVAGWKDLNPTQWANRPPHRELVQLGMTGASGGAVRDSVAEFDLRPVDFLCSWRKRLVVDWPGGERSWYRWADRNVFAIKAITEEDALQPSMMEWDEIRLTHSELSIMPTSWRDALGQWRGVYLIVDRSDRRCYVGSAGGHENLLQRWRDYARTGHGGNKHLRTRDPSNFVFSILQRVSPDLPRDELVAIETTWKKRLDSYWPNGLNQN